MEFLLPPLALAVDLLSNILVHDRFLAIDVMSMEGSLLLFALAVCSQAFGYS
jgi:hypothetical protein